MTFRVFQAAPGHVGEFLLVGEHHQSVLLHQPDPPTLTLLQDEKINLQNPKLEIKVVQSDRVDRC